MYVRSKTTNKLIETLLNTSHVIAVNNGYTHQVFKKFTDIADVIDTAGEVTVTVINGVTGYSEGNIVINLHHKGNEQLSSYKGALVGVIIIGLNKSLGNPFIDSLEEYGVC